MGNKQLSTKSEKMTLNRKNHRNNKSFNKTWETKSKLQACKRAIQSCKDRKVEIPEEFLQMEENLQFKYNEIKGVKYNKDHIRIHKKIAMKLDTDIALVDTGKITLFEDY